MREIVGVADMKVGREDDTLVTHALGSCLGLMIYDPLARVGGLLHAMLPQARINPEKAHENPLMFVDTGIPKLFESVYALGGEKRRLIVKAAGCAGPLKSGEMFKIGQRNYTVLKKMLWKNDILLVSESVGGTTSRTVHFDLSTGKVWITSGGVKEEL